MGTYYILAIGTGSFRHLPRSGRSLSECLDPARRELASLRFISAKERPSRGLRGTAGVGASLGERVHAP
jgi:ABC-type phosphonate transport system ATPase subunit